MCNFCGEPNGCRPTPGYVTDAPLTKEDWAELYHFMRYVSLPFVHRILTRAYARQGVTFTARGKGKRYTKNKEKIG